MLYGEFKMYFNKSKVLKDMDTLLDKLSLKQLKEFIKAHEVVALYTGLDMKQECYLDTAKITLKMK